MITKKIVFRDGRIPSIFFPAGKLNKGGTCQYATKKCLERCPSDCQPNELEKAIYKKFCGMPADKLAKQIHMELLDMNKLFLQWFAWGDCTSKLTEKIAWIIMYLQEHGVVQCGFTRNVKLWQKIKQVTSIGYTVEDKKNISKFCKDGLVAWPEYKTGITHLYEGFNVKEVLVATCSGTWMHVVGTDEPCVINEAQCDICHEKQIGCFKKG